MNNFDRRSFLKTAGICLALPYMPSLIGQTKRDSDVSPNRLLFFDVWLGLEASAFFPKNEGKNYTLSPTLKPLEPLKDKFTVFSNVEHIHVNGGHRSQHALLSGVMLSDAAQFAEGNITADIKASEHVGVKTRYSSLHIGIHSGNNRMSWTRNGNSVPMVTKLNDLFRMLFVDDSKSVKARNNRALAENSSVIDVIMNQAKGVNKQLDKEDKEKLDEYLTSVRETEKKLQTKRDWIDKPKPEVKAPKDLGGSIYKDTEQVYETYYDLVLMALKTDSSRVVSMQFPGGGAPVSLPGIDTGYHLLSHHGKDPERLKQLHIIEQHHMYQLGKFMMKLQNIKEGNSNLLDKTSIFMSGCMGNASSHSNRRLPALLAGGGFKHQGHMKMKQTTEMTNIYVTMLQKFGMNIDKIGPSTGNLNELL
ncbi:MAG: DUF1552 domain-containing protein [Lentisphaeraceae bacterium]|nr:DUF1552 domain-containing protein [Lentisphaeraceae bacterium]